jgi:hypothetical protein
MNHAITVGGLLLAVGALIGLAIAAFGVLEIFAGGMSDAPAEGDAAGKNGCVLLICGALIFVACILWLVHP